MSFYELYFADVVGIIVLYGPILTCAIYMFRLWSRFERLEKQALQRQKDSLVIFTCLRGCLKGLIQTGANGEVERALNELNAYTDLKAAGLSVKE